MERMRPAAIWIFLAALATVLALGGCVKPLDLLSVVEQRVEEATNPQPGILVSSGGTDIPSGGSQSMGSAAVGGADNDVAFLIENPGNAALSLSGTPVVALTGTNAVDFNVPAYPSAAIAAGGSSAFTIRFHPLSAGSKNATVTIVNNTEATPNFTFDLTATATPTPVPAMAVSQTGSIAYNATFTFPATIRTQSVDRVFTITNNGTANLTFDTPAVQVSGTGFALQGAPPAGPVSPGGGTATFTVRFSPAAVTSYSGTVTINSNDPTYPTFVFNLSGTGTEWHGTGIVDDAAAVGEYASLAINGVNVYIAYRDASNTDLNVIRSTNSALSWQAKTIPDSANAGYYTSIATDASNNVSVSYAYVPSIIYNQRFVRSTNGAVSWGSAVTLDTAGGQYSSVTLDGTTIYVAYSTGGTAVHVQSSTNGTAWTKDWDSYSSAGTGFVAAAANNGTLWVAHAASSPSYLAIDNYHYWNLPYTWLYSTADNPTNAVGEYVSAAAYNTNYAYLAYYDASNSALKFVNLTRVGSDPSYLTIGTPKTLDSTGTVGKYASIACSADGVTIYISYYDETNGNLKLAKSTNSGSTFTISTVDSSVDNVGQYSSIAFSGSVVYIAYYDVTNTALKIAKSLDGGATW